MELLKSIITDLHLAGIHDIPANSFMDQEKIDSQELVKAVFNKHIPTELDSLSNNENFDENSLASEMNELFAAFGTGKVPDVGSVEVIATKAAPKAKKAERTKPAIIDPRLRGKSASLEKMSFSPSKTPAKKAIEKPIEFKPELFIKTKIEEDSKILLLLPYKNETVLKSKAEFKLLENILKAANTDFAKTSIIFIDDRYKNITQGAAKYETMLAQTLENELKSIKDEIILCFGQDCLSLAKPDESTIRSAAEKVFDVFENKKLLANYSLSAMLNTPKYKSTTWTNLLLINKI
ncbi:MAG TPA: hypothetical protein DCL21_03425 [Alphaproteobacteria bacterium]|nr:hypothetical protein [Alphaproteobacteria bacterium]